MLEGLHASLILIEDHGYREFGDGDWYLTPWVIDHHDPIVKDGGDYTEIDADGREEKRTPKKFSGKFAYNRYDDLYFDGLVDKTPDTRSNRRVCLTPDGLAKAQELFGPITEAVPVVYEDGVYLVVPNPAGPAVERTVLVRDIPTDEDQEIFRNLDWPTIKALVPDRYHDERMDLVSEA